MSHQIYYTSAPQGIKRGSSGFSTVAVSDAIPRALWDRLEALSAYRHHVSSAAESARAHHNPVSLAHWTLAIAGTSYHVLSRICDSGVDHTQRTNAFAHHLVIEPDDMAPAGPAWMLDQSGVMESAWNGTVGPITNSRPLPRADESPAICSTWAALTGDAGWGGALADAAARSPAKPVCILFSEDQDILPLIAEALRLLPPPKRWDVTFNTYFTSMPTSAQCQWRCCLKNTPAADVALRYASASAGGLVLDLTNPSSLGSPPESEYVTIARTGIVSAATRLRNSAQPSPIRAVARLTVPLTTSSTTPTSPPPSPLLPPIQPPFTPGETPSSPPFPPLDPPPKTPLRTPSTPWGGRRLTDLMHDADDQLSATRQAELDAAKKRRTQILLLYGGALIAIALGMFFVWMAYRASVPPDAIPVSKNALSNPLPDSQLTVTPPPEVPNHTAVTPPVNPDTLPPIPDVSTTQIDSALPPVNPETAPKIIPAPKIITLKTALDRVTSGAGMSDKIQSIAIPATDFADAKALSALLLQLPASRKDYPYKYESLNGTLIIEPANRAGRLGFTIRWKDAGDNSVADIVTIALNKNRTHLELTWKTGIAVKRPELMTLTYWVVQNSALIAEMPKESGGPQRIEFKPIEPKPLSLKDPANNFSFPAELPRETTLVPGPLPVGWIATPYTDWEIKDTALRTPENASPSLKFRKPTTTAAIDSFFVMSFRPGFKSVECDWAKRLATAENDVARYESDLRAIKNATDGSLESKRPETEALVAAYKSAVAGYKELENLEITLTLPDGLKLGTLIFKRNGN